MIIEYEDWMRSEYITIDEKGWHCSEDAPAEIKKKFKEFINMTKSGINIVLED